MTNEELLSVAEIVERLTDRFNAQAALHRECRNEYDKLIASMNADHEAKMVEHRAAFGARTEADRKIIAGLREESAKCQAELDDLYQRVGHSEDELTERYEQTPPEATHAEPDLTQLHAKGKEAWSDVPNATQWVEEMRGNSEATHDTEAGKAAAEAVIRDARNAEIVVGDVVRAKFWKPGQMSTVTKLLPDGRLMLAASSEPWKVDEVVKMVRKCVGADEVWTEVRKVTT